MTSRSDEELVSAWQDGDASAFDEIVTRFSHRVYGICFRYFGDASDAEEATQETFLVLHRRGQSFRGQSRFSTWLYRVTTNVCHDLGRKRSRRPATVPLEASAPSERAQDAGEQRTPAGSVRGGHGAQNAYGSRDTPGPLDAQDALVAAELGSEIASALRALEVSQRTAVVLHDVYGYPYEDIAQHTGVAVGTVKSRVHRGHARLAEALAHLRQQPSASREPAHRGLPAHRGEPVDPGGPVDRGEPSGPREHLTE